MGKEDDSVGNILTLLQMAGGSQFGVNAKSRFAGRLRGDTNIEVEGERGRVCILERIRDGLER